MMALVLEAAARSLVLGSCVWLALAVLRPRNPYLQKTVWLGVLVASLAMPVLLWADLAPSIEAPSEYMDTNVQGTVRVLECARHANVRKFVYAASSSCYGLASTPTREDHPIDPQYPYALSKYQGEQAVFHWHRVYRLPVNSICIFNAYGTRVRTTGVYGAVFGVFLKQKLAGKPFTVVGDGTQSRDFVYASDVATAFLAAAQSDISGERFNVGAGNPQTINRLVELLGGDVIHVPKRPGEPDCTFADNAPYSSDPGAATIRSATSRCTRYTARSGRGASSA